MKKIVAMALLLGLGVMVGCGDDTKKPSTSKTMSTTVSTGATATPAAGTDKK